MSIIWIRNPLTNTHPVVNMFLFFLQTPKGIGYLIKLLFKYEIIGVPIVAQQVKNLTSIHEDSGSIPGLIQWL